MNWSKTRTSFSPDHQGPAGFIQHEIQSRVQGLDAPSESLSLIKRLDLASHLAKSQQWLISPYSSCVCWDMRRSKRLFALGNTLAYRCAESPLLRRRTSFSTTTSLSCFSSKKEKHTSINLIQRRNGGGGDWGIPGEQQEKSRWIVFEAVEDAGDSWDYDDWHSPGSTKSKVTSSLDYCV